VILQLFALRLLVTRRSAEIPRSNAPPEMFRAAFGATSARPF
jgi:hypothetical protein